MDIWLVKNIDRLRAHQWWWWNHESNTYSIRSSTLDPSADWTMISGKQWPSVHHHYSSGSSGEVSRSTLSMSLTSTVSIELVCNRWFCWTHWSTQRCQCDRRRLIESEWRISCLVCSYIYMIWYDLWCDYHGQSRCLGVNMLPYINDFLPGLHCYELYINESICNDWLNCFGFLPVIPCRKKKNMIIV